MVIGSETEFRSVKYGVVYGHTVGEKNSVVGSLFPP
jgi:hypothetical protein